MDIIHIHMISTGTGNGRLRTEGITVKENAKLISDLNLTTKSKDLLQFEGL